MNRLGRLLGALPAIATLMLATCTVALAGEINVAWDPATGASGYKVYYGTSSGQYTSSMTVYGTSAVITGLPDCQTHYVAVKAFNSLGESAQFSNELSGWSRPAVTSSTPASAAQGDQFTMDIYGSNFQTGALVELSNPRVVTTSVSVLSCSRIQLLATIEPMAKKIPPARIGKLDVTVSNPDDVFGMRSQAFEVLINPSRFDINQADAVTKDRIDGKDTVYISRDFGQSETDANYEPDDDFDGDGWVDGTDLAYIASNFGRCWSPSTKSWSIAACPANLR